MRAADPISEGPPLMVARPAMLKRDTTEAGHHPGLSRCRWLGMRNDVVCWASGVGVRGRGNHLRAGIAPVLGDPLVIAAGVTVSGGGLAAALVRHRRGGQQRSPGSDKDRRFDLW